MVFAFFQWPSHASCDSSATLVITVEARIQADELGHYQLQGAPQLLPFFHFLPPSAAFPHGLCLLELGDHVLLMDAGASLHQDSAGPAPALLIRSSCEFELAAGALLAGSARGAAGAWQIEARSIALAGSLLLQNSGGDGTLLWLQVVASAYLSAAASALIELDAARGGFGSLLLQSCSGSLDLHGLIRASASVGLPSSSSSSSSSSSCSIRLAALDGDLRSSGNRSVLIPSQAARNLPAFGSSLRSRLPPPVQLELPA